LSLAFDGRRKKLYPTEIPFLVRYFNKKNTGVKEICNFVVGDNIEATTLGKDAYCTMKYLSSIVNIRITNGNCTAPGAYPYCSFETVSQSK
jgi:hypothetical protein